MRIASRPDRAVPVIAIAIWLAMALYYKALFDVAVLALLLATAFSLGAFFRPRRDTRSAETLGFRLCIGIGVLAMLVWLSTFKNYHYRELYLTVSIVSIIWQRRKLWRAVRQIARTVVLHGRRNPVFLVAPFAVVTLFEIFASYPVSKFDAITKHIAIPTKILHSTHYDYNVIESIIFGDSSLLTHMLALYLMAFGSKKGPIFLVAALSGLALIFLLRLLRKVCAKKRWPAALSVLVYGSTPLILLLSTAFYVDSVPLPFLLFAVAYVVMSRRDQIVGNTPALFFLMGSAFFAKQTAAYLVIPIVVSLVWLHVAAVARSERHVLESARAFGVGLLLFVLPSAGPLLIIWHKTGNPFFPMANAFFESPYFPIRNFADPFENPLGFDLGSLVSMVFHSNLNIEMGPGGFGLHVLLLPLAVLVPVFRRDRRMILVVALVLGAYFCSTRVTYNLRYLLPALVLSIVPIAYALEWLVSFVEERRLHTLAWLAATLLLVGPNLQYIFSGTREKGYDWNARFAPVLLKPHDSLTAMQISPMLEEIPDRRASILYGSSVPYRGAYPGYYSTLSWHNAYIAGLVRDGEVEFSDLLYGFDYLMRSKVSPVESFAQYLHDSEPLLEIVIDGRYDSLYRIRREPIVAVERSLGEPFRATAMRPYRVPLDPLYHEVEISLDLEVPDDGRPRATWFQIDWSEAKTGKRIGGFRARLALEPGRRTWQLTRRIAPESGRLGALTVKSSNDAPIFVHGVSVKSRPVDALTPLLAEYDRSWPHLAQRID
ncbi:MAG: glycosyltransferase family 39 protein [Myxococcales bacterium]|nr:glycosyltransferase family 39 protein [Myxococcales bacterium]